MQKVHMKTERVSTHSIEIHWDIVDDLVEQKYGKVFVSKKIDFDGIGYFLQVKFHQEEGDIELLFGGKEPKENAFFDVKISQKNVCRSFNAKSARKSEEILLCTKYSTVCENLKIHTPRIQHLDHENHCFKKEVLLKLEVNLHLFRSSCEQLSDPFVEVNFFEDLRADSNLIKNESISSSTPDFLEEVINKSDLPDIFEVSDNSDDDDSESYSRICDPGKSSGRKIKSEKINETVQPTLGAAYSLKHKNNELTLHSASRQRRRICHFSPEIAAQLKQEIAASSEFSRVSAKNLLIEILKMKYGNERSFKELVYPLLGKRKKKRRIISEMTPILHPSELYRTATLDEYYQYMIEKRNMDQQEVNGLEYPSTNLPQRCLLCLEDNILQFTQTMRIHIWSHLWHMISTGLLLNYRHSLNQGQWSLQTLQSLFVPTNAYSNCGVCMVDYTSDVDEEEHLHSTEHLIVLMCMTMKICHVAEISEMKKHLRLTLSDDDYDSDYNINKKANSNRNAKKRRKEDEEYLKEVKLVKLVKE